jgi:hypothetical protein
MAEDTRYATSVFLLRSWHVDTSYPDDSIGGHLCWLTDMPCIAALMNKENLHLLDFLLGPDGFKQYQAKVSEKKRERRVKSAAIMVH